MKKIFLGLVLIFSTVHLEAQVAITAVPFLEINGDASSRGLAGADVAKIGRNGLHLNPAAMGPYGTLQLTSPFTMGGSVPAYSTNWLPNFNLDELWISSPKVLIGLDRLVIGYQMNYLNLGKQTVTTSSGSTIVDTHNAYEFNHGISLSYSISDYVSVGAGFNFIKSDLFGENVIAGDTISAATQVSVDFGVYAQKPIETELFVFTPSLGWSITDFGYPISYTSDELNEDPLPIIMRGGLGLTIDLKQELAGYRIISIGAYGALSKIMARTEINQRYDRNGLLIEEREVMGPFEALYNSWDTWTFFNGQETIELSVWEQLRRHSAIELTLLEIVELRFGRFYEDEYNGDRNYNTFGVGFKYPFFSFDYSEIRNIESDSPLRGTKFYQFTINIPLERINTLFDQ